MTPAAPLETVYVSQHPTLAKSKDFPETQQILIGEQSVAHLIGFLALSTLHQSRFYSCFAVQSGQVHSALTDREMHGHAPRTCNSLFWEYSARNCTGLHAPKIRDFTVRSHFARLVSSITGIAGRSHS